MITALLRSLEPQRLPEGMQQGVRGDYSSVHSAYRKLVGLSVHSKADASFIIGNTHFFIKLLFIHAILSSIRNSQICVCLA